ncbi:MATE family efflux transporter [Treponema phagedenis]|nr:MATE family efflux transporter [Treponema phagedenis]QEJ96374.1 MATE family efflux transporter [Treponema phagedenis]QEJ99531.1 MATE family efflux transporter [Treponema phagedenis]QEK02170.1 MATE family efflux transporter [Treponema phagedenis]QEK05102.1 MATE family efflux transporter [Treponema phagedenis]
MKKAYTAFGPIHFYKSALKIAVPVMIQLFVQTLVSLIDNFMVAGLGDIKMSGVNVVNQFLFLFITALTTLSIAGGIFMAQYSGAKNAEGMQQSYRFKILSMGLLSALLMAVSLLFPDQILGFLVSGNIQQHAIVAEGKSYLYIIVLTFIPMALSTAIASSLRETGDVKPPMYIVIVSTIVNTIGNYILIYGNFGAPRLEVQGAAYSTVIARIVELVLFIAYVNKANSVFYVRFIHLFNVKLSLFGDILKKSGWIFAADMSWGISETVATALYNSRGGAEVVAGMSAGWTIANLFFLIFPAVGTSIAVIVGGTLGKNKLEEAKQQARWLMNGSVIAGFFVGILEFCSVILTPIVFGQLSAESQAVTKNLIWIIALYMPLWTYQNSQYAISRAGGDALLGAWVDLTVNLTLFMPGMYVLTYFTNLSAPVMYGVVKISSGVKAILAGWQLKKERWVKNLTAIDRL